MFDRQIIIIMRSDSPRAPYETALSKFKRLHFTSSAVEGLQFLEASPAHVAFIESECEDMTGIEIAEAIRDIDEEINHFTYICLVGREPADSLVQSTVDTIDSHLLLANKLLAAVAFAGTRLANKINDLAEHNLVLQRANIELQRDQLLDPLTGLGNQNLAEQSLNDSIRQIESRGGAVCVLVMAVTNFKDVIESHNQRIADELVVAVAQKIDHLVRPLDLVSYCGEGRFVLILVQPSIEHCREESYKRIFDGVSLKTYGTAGGYLPAGIAMSICASHALNGTPSHDQLFNGAMNGLKEAIAQKKVIVKHLSPAEEKNTD